LPDAARGEPGFDELIDPEAMTPRVIEDRQFQVGKDPGRR
jgi:hypothetical protein